MQRFIGALAAAALSAAGPGIRTARADEAGRVRRVLLISVDGLHQRDLARFIASHPASTLARLSRSGVTYDEARSTTPSDSFPGLLALVTGGTLKSTGVYNDDGYDRTLYAPGSNCQGAAGSAGPAHRCAGGDDPGGAHHPALARAPPARARGGAQGASEGPAGRTVLMPR